MTLRLGILGLSPGNGHPFSFSAIVNGYDDAAFADFFLPRFADILKQNLPGITMDRLSHFSLFNPRGRCVAFRDDIFLK